MAVYKDAREGAEFDAGFLDAYTGGDPEMRDEVLKIFLDQSRLLLARLEDAMEEGQAWRDAAHSMKGCARSVGANTLADIAARAEGEGPSHPVRLRALDEMRAALLSTHAKVEALMRPA